MERYFVGKERFVDVEGISIKIKFTKDDFEKLFNKKYYEEDDFVTCCGASEWIKRCIIGNISKEDLDQ